MQNPKKANFIQLLMDSNVLRFGEFTLKSGRISPYFFNMGAIDDGAGLSQLGAFYADTILSLNLNVDCLYGPAYKGIPLVAATSMAFYYDHQQSVPYCFNRKQAKSYGDGGDLVGAPLQGNIIMVDDVITAGTTVHETVELFSRYGVKPAGMVIALDREEKNQDSEHALTAVSKHFNVPIQPIVTLTDVINYLSQKPEFADQLQAIQAYQAEYGATPTSVV